MQRLPILSFAFRGQGVTRVSWLMPSNLAVKLGEKKIAKKPMEGNCLQYAVGVGSEKVPVGPRLTIRNLKHGCNRKTFLMGKETEGSGCHPCWGPSEGVNGALCLSLPPSILLILEGIRKGKGERDDDSAFGPKQEGLAQAALPQTAGPD